MIDHLLVQDGQIIPTTTDKHGDQIAGSPVDIKCWFRYVTGIEKGTNQEALNGIDAIIRVSPDLDVSEGTILKVEGKYWRVDRLIKARRIGDSAVQYLKAYVQAYQL